MEEVTSLKVLIVNNLKLRMLKRGGILKWLQIVSKASIHALCYLMPSNQMEFKPHFKFYFILDSALHPSNLLPSARVDPRSTTASTPTILQSAHSGSFQILTKSCLVLFSRDIQVWTETVSEVGHFRNWCSGFRFWINPFDQKFTPSKVDTCFPFDTCQNPISQGK